jgi:excisionase family DNA binding protein
MADTESKSRIMTLKEVADYLRVNQKTIHRLLDRNAIPATRVGKLWRFDSRAIERWLEERAVPEKTRILVMDEEVPVRLLIKKILSRFGHEVVAAGSGEEGMRLMEEETFDMVFLDPVISSDGAGIFRYIKVVNPYMPVVVMTGAPGAIL